MITSCNCVSGGSGVCILCLFMPFAKVSLVEGLGSLHYSLHFLGPMANTLSCYYIKNDTKQAQKHKISSGNHTRCFHYSFRQRTEWQSVWVAERWGNIRTNIHERAGRSDSKAAFGFPDKICSNFSFGFQVVRVLGRSNSGGTSVSGSSLETTQPAIQWVMWLPAWVSSGKV